MSVRVLAIGGSDPTGGAGVQADLKTIALLGGAGSCALTAVTVQDTRQVRAVNALTPQLVTDQIEAVLQDIGADAIKTGMLGTAAIVSAVANQARRARVPLVVDPVLTASTGGALLSSEALELMRSELLPMAAVLTPNVPEAEALTGVKIDGVEAMGRAAELCLAMGASAVLVKGGHLAGEEVVDLLRTVDGQEERFTSSRLDVGEVHGTGCVLASAIALGVAEGLRLTDAIEGARRFLRRAMQEAERLGKGQALLKLCVAAPGSDVTQS